MAKYHVSQDGKSRVCSARSAESCTAVGPDGASAPHGDFSTASEALAFAESVNAAAAGAFLDSAQKAPETGSGRSNSGVILDALAETKRGRLEARFGEFHRTEFGSQFSRGSLKSNADGESFTAVVEEGFRYNWTDYRPGDKVTLDEDFSIVPSWRR